MSNPNSGTPQQPGNAPPQGITQEYVAQLVRCLDAAVRLYPRSARRV